MIELQTMPLRFRVWDKDEKKFVKSVTISGPQCWPCRFNLVSGYFEMNSDDRFIISQDTGTKDSNGKAIFTGDIVAQRSPIGSVYGVAECRYGDCYVRYPSGLHGSLVSDTDLEVVGNIWQNSELLEKAKDE